MDDSPFCCLLCHWPLYDPCDLPHSLDHCQSDHRWTLIHSMLSSLLCALLLSVHLYKPCGAFSTPPTWAATSNAILITPRHHCFRAVLRAGADVGAEQITYISAFWHTRYINDMLFHAIFSFAANVNCDHPQLQPAAVTQCVNSTCHAIPH